jgi:hypothetical protein
MFHTPFRPEYEKYNSWSLNPQGAAEREQEKDTFCGTTCEE